MERASGMEANGYTYSYDENGPSNNTAAYDAYYADDSELWNSRVAQFYHDMLIVSRQDNLTQTEKKDLISDLKSSMFSAKEQVKLAVQSIRNRVAQTE